MPKGMKIQIVKQQGRKIQIVKQQVQKIKIVKQQWLNIQSWFNLLLTKGEPIKRFRNEFLLIYVTLLKWQIKLAYKLLFSAFVVFFYIGCLTHLLSFICLYE